MFAMVAKGQRGDQRRRRRKIDHLFVSYFPLQTDSSRCRENFRDANQIVCRCRQHKEPFHQAASASKFRVLRGAILPYEVVQPRAAYVDSVKAWKFMLRDSVWDLEGVVDVTDELRAAEAEI
jgi:hypothetical protein